MLNRLAAVLVVLSVAGCRTVEPPPPPDAPRVTSFAASKARIAAGESVTLSFTTSGATRVDVTDDSGRDVVLAGTAESGTATVAPTRSSFYVLRATGVGGRDTAFVQVAVNEPLKDLFLSGCDVGAAGVMGAFVGGILCATAAEPLEVLPWLRRVNAGDASARRGPAR